MRLTLIITLFCLSLLYFFGDSFKFTFDKEVPKCYYTEKECKVCVGDVWATDLNRRDKGTPFYEPKIHSIKIMDVKEGYYQYRYLMSFMHSWVGFFKPSYREFNDTFSYDFCGDAYKEN